MANRLATLLVMLAIGGILAGDVRGGEGSQNQLAYDYDHGFAHLWPLKYPPDFEHFDYANPDAPRGGTMRIPQLGTWDSFNSFIDRGRQAAGMSFLSAANNLFYDRLMSGAADEPVSSYGRLAEGVKVADDFSWIAFKLRENAYWHDGESITVEDVVFTFETFKTKASAWVRNMIANVDRIEQIGPWEVKYVMKEGVTPNPGMASPIGVMPIIPKHYWEDRDPSKTTTEPPLGSGPYRIKDYRLGRSITYERVENYWGEDIPTMKGRFNFDEIKFDYFRDTKVMMEAHRGHLVDIRSDENAKNWNIEYDFPAAQAGVFKKQLFEQSSPVGLEDPIFWNMRRERFQDRRVRKALWLLYDFEFINRVIHFGFFERGTSLFHGAPEMMQSGLPDERELELLEPWRDQLPPRLFTEPYEVPENSGYGLSREHLERALDLFAEAGWVQHDGELINQETGEQFSIDFVLVSHSQSRELLPYVDILNKVGIDTSVRVPEVSNWLYRMQTSEFDGSIAEMYPYRVPGIALRNHFGSASAETGFGVNWGYVKHPAIDALANHVIQATEKNAFLSAVTAADRVLLWNFYFIPTKAERGTPMVYWDKFGRVETEPLERVPWMDAWWWDEEKARRVRQWLADKEHEQGAD